MALVQKYIGVTLEEGGVKPLNLVCLTVTINEERMACLRFYLRILKTGLFL